ncbi:MAG TPA: DHA2 family efflux MFS transporter permease subunit [Candidatus Baltobacteraceae bacterium]|nr:DHA2 family efflux MFS transporter permease subunit [Candidatus Baltobacteraceae bacterium]
MQSVLKPSRVVVNAASVSPAAILGVVMLGNFLGPLYSSTANVIIPNLIASFGSDVDTMEWVVTGYMLGYSITMPLAGWLADTLGRRRMFLIGLIIFTGFSIAASMAWSTSSLIAFRILQAVGGGIVSPTGMAIVTDVIPLKDRGKAFGLWGMGMMLAPAFGPWISGLLVDHLGDWRPIFLLGVPFGIAGLLAAMQYLPRSEDQSHNSAHTPFDSLGFALLSSSLTAFLIPLTQGNRVGWDDAWVRISLVLSAVLFASFIVRELRTQHPMLDLSLFRDRVFSIATSLRFVLGMGYYFSIFLLPLFTQDILGWDATQSGFILMPAGLAMAVLMPISGILVDKIGARVLIFSGMVLAAYGTLLFARIDTDWTMQHLIVVNVIRTAALGLLFTPLTTAALVNVPRHRTGAASGILNTIWQVGGSLGIAVGQSYLTARAAARYNEVASSLVQSRPAAWTFFGKLHAMAAAHHWPAGTARAMLAQMAQGMAVVRAYDDTFLLGALLIGVSAPLALFLRYKAAAHSRRAA